MADQLGSLVTLDRESITLVRQAADIARREARDQVTPTDLLRAADELEIGPPWEPVDADVVEPGEQPGTTAGARELGEDAAREVYDAIKDRDRAEHRPPGMLPLDSGERELLVFGQCQRCGWRCACPEAAIWPSCPVCTGEVHPDRVADIFEGRWAYVATFMPEAEAVDQVQREQIARHSGYSRGYGDGLRKRRSI